MIFQHQLEQVRLPAEPLEGDFLARLGCFLPRKQPGLGLSQQPDRPEGSQRATEHGGHPASRGKTPPWGAKSGEKWERRPPWRYGKGSAASALSQSCFHAAPKAPEGPSHDQTVESGTRSRENIKTHSFFPIRGKMSPCCSSIRTFICRVSPAV